MQRLLSFCTGLDFTHRHKKLRLQFANIACCREKAEDRLADESLKQEQKKNESSSGKLHQQLRPDRDAWFVFTPQSVNSPEAALGLGDFESLGEACTLHIAEKECMGCVQGSSTSNGSAGFFFFLYTLTWKWVPGLKVSLPPHQPLCAGRATHKAAGGWRPGVQGGPSLTTTPCLITSLPWPCVHPALSSK